jgi:Ca2+-binding EF-hand superfamily protein
MTMKKTLTFALVTGLAFGTSAAVFAEGMHRGGHGEHFWNKLDTNQDGKITRDELKADVSTLFSAVDTNKDGKVTQEEASQYFAAKHAEMKAKFADKLKESDKNKDGKWSKDELSQLSQRRFSKLDTNSDGVVTQAELDAHRAERQARFQEKHADKPKGKLFKHADANSDGVVDGAEALKVAETHFSKLDQNGDGAVERTELKSGHHGRGKHDCGDKGDKQGSTKKAVTTDRT